MNKKILSILLFFASIPSFVFAQTGSLSGTVTDANSGESLPAVNVVIKELVKGTSTDVDGTYTISSIPVGTYTVVVRYIGYVPFENTIEISSGTNSLDIALEEDVLQLEEVVVTGYGSLQKKEISGSVTSLKMESLQNVPVQSFEQAIQGRAAGVQVTNSTGAPGAAVQIRVRGQGSINAGNSPLYIVDGVQVNSGDFSSSAPSSNVLSSINPNDIASISILKDAAAASIYGARAANGVVIITTKRGNAGATEFDLSVRQGYQEVIKRIDVLSSAELIQLTRESLENYGFGEGTITGFMDGRFGANQPEDATTNTDWADAYFQKGLGQSYNLSARGGDEKTRFFISGGYDSQEGQVINSDYQRLSLQTNIDHQATENLSFKASVNLSNSELNSIPSGGAFASPYRAGILTLPTEAVRNEDGTFNTDLEGTYYFNTVYDTDLNINETVNKRLIGNLGATYNFNDNISFETSNSVDYFTVSDYVYWDPRSGDGENYNGYARKNVYELTNFSTSQVLNFVYNFDQVHDVTGLVGFEYREQNTESFGATATDFPSFQFKSLSSAAGYFGDPSQSTSTFRTAGYFGRVNYTYDNKYIVSATARYDGSSRFGSENKYGFFPALSAAWRIINEDFMADVDVIDDLKIRVGVGVTGNDAIGNFASRGLYGGGANYGGSPGLSPSQVANPQLSWEEATTFNYGVDFALLNGRVTGSAEYFLEKTTKLLFDRAIPGTTGYTEITQNVGSVNNSGIEIAISTTNYKTQDFSWVTDFNITFLKNEVTGLFDDLDQLGTDLFVGEAIGVFYANRYAGVNPADGRPMWYDIDGNITYTRSPDDRVILGSRQPDNFGGVNNTFNYKGFQLETFFQWSAGNYLSNSDRFFGERVGNTVDRNQWATVNDRWRQPGDVTSVPVTWYLNRYGRKADGTVVNDGASTYYTTGSSHFIEDASYLRLKRAKFSYAFDKAVIDQIGFRSLSLFIQGTNLITWTEFTGYDPEVTGGSTFGDYPQGKTYTFGINVGF